MGLALTTALGILGHPITQSLLPAAGSLVGNVLSGFNQRAARKWEEDMYNKYNSPSAMVRQYQEAGINPALMFGQPTPAAPTDTSAASVVDSNTGTMADMLGQIMQLSLLEEQRDSLRATTRKENASAGLTELETEIKEEFSRLEHQYGISEMIARINKLEAEYELTEYERKTIGPLKAALYEAQSRGLNADSFIAEWRGNFIREHGSDPDASADKQFISSLMDNPRRERRERKKEIERNSSNHPGGGSR